MERSRKDAHSRPHRHGPRRRGPRGVRPRVEPLAPGSPPTSPSGAIPDVGTAISRLQRPELLHSRKVQGSEGHSPRSRGSGCRAGRRWAGGRTDVGAERGLVAALVAPVNAGSLPSGTGSSTMYQRLRGVAQLGSASALGAEGRWFESSRPDHVRVWFNGRTSAFQADDAGSTPVTRSTESQQPGPHTGRAAFLLPPHGARHGLRAAPPHGTRHAPHVLPYAFARGCASRYTSRMCERSRCV